MEEEDPAAAPEADPVEAADPEAPTEEDSAGNAEVKKYEELIDALNQFHET